LHFTDEKTGSENLSDLLETSLRFRTEPGPGLGFLTLRSAPRTALVFWLC
jgi:hypothetical protein